MEKRCESKNFVEECLHVSSLKSANGVSEFGFCRCNSVKGSSLKVG